MSIRTENVPACFKSINRRCPVQSSDAGHRLASGQHSGTAVQNGVSRFLRLALWQLKAALNCSCSRLPEHSPGAVQHAMRRGVQFAKLCGARGRAVCKAVRCSGACSLQSRLVLWACCADSAVQLEWMGPGCVLYGLEPDVDLGGAGSTSNCGRQAAGRRRYWENCVEEVGAQARRR